MEDILNSKFESLVLGGKAEWRKSDRSKHFGKYVDSLPWNVNRIDFEKIGRKFESVDLYTEDDAKTKAFLEGSVLSSYQNIAFMYDDNSPMLVTTFKNILIDLKEYLTYQGDALAFGYDDLENCDFADFLCIYDWKATTFLK